MFMTGKGRTPLSCYLAGPLAEALHPQIRAEASEHTSRVSTTGPIIWVGPLVVSTQGVSHLQAK